LSQWLELRARVIGTHPLNLKRQDILSPAALLGQLRTMQRNDSSESVDSFAEKFDPLSSFSVLSLQLRVMVLIHFNDLLLPLLPLVFEGNQRNQGEKLPAPFVALNCLIASNRPRVFLEVLVSV
jgi:hypothetical protein